MELVLEIIIEVYLGLAEILVPEHKFKKWQEVLLKVLAILIALAILICLAAGIALIVEEGKTLGIVLTSVGGVLLAVQLVLVVIVLVYDYKKNKKQKNISQAQELAGESLENGGLGKTQVNKLLFDDVDDNLNDNG